MTTLTYFDIRGRAEPARLVLEYLEAPYTDKRVSFDEWPTLKATLPFGQVPMYKDDQVEIPQSMAIVRHIGRKHNLYGATNAEKALVDVLIDGVGDLGTNFFKLLSSPEFKGGDKKPLNDQIEKSLTEFEKFKGSHKFMVGDNVTIADFVLFNMLDNFVKPLAPEILKAHGAIEQYRQSIASLKTVAAYLGSSRRPAITLPPFFGALCSPDVCK